MSEKSRDQNARPTEDDNLDDKGRDVNSGQLDKERHPQADGDEDARRKALDEAQKQG